MIVCEGCGIEFGCCTCPPDPYQQQVQRTYQLYADVVAELKRFASEYGFAARRDWLFRELISKRNDLRDEIHMIAVDERMLRYMY